MRWITIFLLLISLNSATSMAQTGQSINNSNYQQWMANYYIQKDTSKVIDFLQWIQKEKLLEANPTMVAPLLGFLAIVFTDNPSQTAAWIKNVKYTGKMKEEVDGALTISKDLKSKPLTSLIVKQPADLDMMWGAFSASGDTTFVKKVISILDEKTIINPDEKLDALIRGAASWSLASNASQHELVDRVVHQSLKTESPIVQKKLKDIIAQNQSKRKPFPNRDGDFSAGLVLLDEKALKEFDKPPHETVKLEQKTQIKRGDKVAVKILFSGMKLAEDLMADVSFDLKILSPDGKVYTGSDVKNALAIKTKVPTPFNIYDDQATMMIEFEPQDKLGTYKISAVVNDNVGKKKVALSEKIKLVE